MGFGRYLAAAALSALLASPVLAQTAAHGTSTTGPAATAPSTTQPRMAAGSQEQGLVDINSASEQELDKLPGVGPARAQAIAANRPYKSKDELARRKILPQNVYDQIKDKIVARQASMKESTGQSSAPVKTR